MRATIRPSRAEGKVLAPPSKSMAHRLLICAGLSGSDEPSIVRGLEENQDVLATIDCLEQLNAVVRYDKDATAVYGIHSEETRAQATLPCRECGSTLRFFIPICLALGGKYTLTGSETLMGRPQDVYEKICAEQNLLFERTPDGIGVEGPLRPGTFKVAGNISSQFISGLLFSLPLLNGDSVIEIEPPVESRPYIDMTVQALAEFGIAVSWQDDHTLFVAGNQAYQNKCLRVEGDYSNAAFLDALTTLGGDVQVVGLKDDSLQGDRVYRQHLAALSRSTATINLSDCPDLGPVLMAVAAGCRGGAFTGCKRLAIKESNRAHAMREELAKFGVKVVISDDDSVVIVDPRQRFTPSETLSGHNDHRIVMALAVLCTQTGGVIEGAQAVNKSFPDFFEKLANLGVDVTLEDE